METDYNKIREDAENSANEVARKWLLGIKIGKLNISKVIDRPYLNRLLDVSIQLQEFEVSKMVQNRIDELNCTHPDEFVISLLREYPEARGGREDKQKLLCLNCGKNIN